MNASAKLASADFDIGCIAKWTSHPKAPKSRCVIVNVGSIRPSSTRLTVEVGTPDLRASSLREMPLCWRVSLSDSEIDTWVAYMQPLALQRGQRFGESVEELRQLIVGVGQAKVDHAACRDVDAAL